jgi:hypothetical protein
MGPPGGSHMNPNRNREAEKSEVLNQLPVASRTVTAITVGTRTGACS